MMLSSIYHSSLVELFSCGIKMIRLVSDVWEWLVAYRPVTLVVAKCWDPSPKSYLSPRQEPVRPIDPSAWVAHTEAVRAIYGRLGAPPSVTGMPASNSPTFMASVPESSCKWWHKTHINTVLLIYVCMYVCICISTQQTFMQKRQNDITTVNNKKVTWIWKDSE